MNDEENRVTNPIRFLTRDGHLAFSQPAAQGRFAFDFSRPALPGRAYYNGNDSLIYSPMDFTRHNTIPLEDLQLTLRSVLFSESVPAARGST